jgi:hypothetical protein
MLSQSLVRLLVKHTHKWDGLISSHIISSCARSQTHVTLTKLIAIIEGKVIAANNYVSIFAFQIGIILVVKASFNLSTLASHCDITKCSYL